MEMVIKFLIIIGLYIFLAIIMKGKGVPFFFIFFVPVFFVSIIGMLFYTFILVLIEDLQERFLS